MKRKFQILIVHGGMTFKNRENYLDYLKTREISFAKRVNWKGSYLEKHLGKRFEIIRPKMPLKENANYKDWKIHFERYLEHLRDNVILIGNSLGGIFLAKYLSENKFSKKILSAYLICPPFENSLPNEDLVGGFKLKSDLSLLEENSQNLYLMFSKNDDVVPVSHAEKFQRKLKKAKIIIYKNKNGHFNISTFPEIIKKIKLDVKSVESHI